MKIQCVYCNKDMGEKPPYNIILVSHGCCEDCFKKKMKELDEEELAVHSPS